MFSLCEQLHVGKNESIHRCKNVKFYYGGCNRNLVNCGKNIPSEAIETACFIQDVNNLFGSFNSTGIRVNKYNPRYRCPLTKNSFHWQFWESMT
jgi:hypothetical protein